MRPPAGHLLRLLHLLRFNFHLFAPYLAQIESRSVASPNYCLLILTLMNRGEVVGIFLSLKTFPQTTRSCVVSSNRSSYSNDVLIYIQLGRPESQKPRWRGGIANRKVFACPESFCAYIQIGPKIKSKHNISL